MPFCGIARQNLPNRRRISRSVGRCGNQSARILWVFLLKSAVMGVPFENEGSSKAGAALAEGDGEGGRADRLRHGAGQSLPQCRGGRRDLKAEGGCRRLG